MKLREYQIEAIQAILDKWEMGVDRQLVVLPTGAGKTVIMGNAIKARKGRALFIAHRNELILQAQRSIQAIVGDGVRVATSKDRNFHSADIIVATVQSLRKGALEAIAAHGDMRTIVVDEAHHSSAPSYRNAIKHFLPKLGDKPQEFDAPHPYTLLLGCTATPNRSDGVPVKGIFKEIVYSLPIVNLIKSGHLCKVECRVVILPTPKDIVVRTRCGDFVEGDLVQLDTEFRNKIIVDAHERHARHLKTIGFCMSIAHAENLARMMRERGVVARAVHGKLTKKEICAIFADFRAGKIEAMMSRDLIIEGFDDPSVECILMCRPTKSQTVYKQAIGRGLRYFEGKESCLVIDFCDMGHSLRGACNMGCIDFFALILFAMLYKLGRWAVAALEEPVIEEEERVKAVEEEAKNNRKPKTITKVIGERMIDIVYSSKFVWVPVGEGDRQEMYTISSDPKAYLQAVVIGKSCEDGLKPYPHYTIKLVYRRDLDGNEIPISERSVYSMAMYDDSIVYDRAPKFAVFKSFEEAMEHAEARAEKFLKNEYYTKESMNNGTPISERQLQHFGAMGATEDMTMGELNMLKITKDAYYIHNILTEKPTKDQQMLMYNLGLKVNAKTKHLASQAIDKEIKRRKDLKEQKAREARESSTGGGYR